MPFVLDASVTVAWYLPDEQAEFGRRVRDRLLADVAFVPPIWATEVGNAFLIAVRRSRVAFHELAAIRASLLSLPITIDGANAARPLGPVLELAHFHGLTVYDATYVEVALRRSSPLATLDERLRVAAARAGALTLT